MSNSINKVFKRKSLPEIFFLNIKLYYFAFKNLPHFVKFGLIFSIIYEICLIICLIVL